MGGAELCYACNELGTELNTFGNSCTAQLSIRPRVNAVTCSFLEFMRLRFWRMLMIEL